MPSALSIAFLCGFTLPPSALGLAQPTVAPGRPPTVAQSGPQEPVEAVRTVNERWLRDARLSFQLEGLEQARVALDHGLLVAPRERAAAFVALGCAGGVAEIPRLLAASSSGSAYERKGAVLALGELGPSAWDALAVLVEDPLGVEEAVAVALVRTRDARGLQTLERLSSAAAGNLAIAAGRVMEWAKGALPPESVDALELLLDLRWEAAKRYGLVDGQRYAAILAGELAADQEFLERFLSLAALDLDPDLARDHLLGLVLEGSTPGRLAGAGILIPGELERLILAELWKPGSVLEWRALLDEISARSAEGPARGLLEAAFQVPEVSRQAGLLLLRSGGLLPAEFLDAELAASGPRPRAILLDALGRRGDSLEIERLQRYLLPSENLAVRASALVALARLGDTNGRRELDVLLQGSASQPLEELALVLARCTEDPWVERLAVALLQRDDLGAEARFQLEVGLARRGRLATRESLRAWVAVGQFHALRQSVVRALGVRGDAADRRVIKSLFPVEGDLGLNVELALALTRFHDPEVLELLRAALWRAPLESSLLAAGLLTRALTLQGLIDELETPPKGALEEDQRRVGFAVGEWGGVEGLEALTRRLSPSSPAVQGAYLGALASKTR